MSSTTAKKLPQVIGTGLSGLVGSKVVELLSNDYQFENIDLSHPTHPTDITKYDQVQRVLASSDADTVLHFAAFTDVTKSWEQRGDKNGVAYQVNVVGTENIAKAAAEAGKHLIHISTAYVFDGKKAEPYTEQDPLSPIEWYGETKAIAEQVVQDNTDKWTILRIDQPFRSDPFNRPDVVHRIIAGLLNGTLPPQFTNHYLGPTFVDDFALVVQWAIAQQTVGIFHASAGEQWTDYDLATAVQETLKIPGQVEKGDLDAYLAKSHRPYARNTALSTQKLRQLLPQPQVSVREALKLVTFVADATQ